MVSVTMAANPPPFNPATGIVIFDSGPGQREQIHAYYEAHFRAGPHMSPMETFARFVLEKGYGAYSPRQVKDDNGKMVRETWQACGRRLFGDRFIEVMDRVVNEHKTAHIVPTSTEVPPRALEEIPDPEF